VRVPAAAEVDGRQDEHAAPGEPEPDHGRERSHALPAVARQGL
jgi:hypothetical protein